ncbi:hypothetical protein HL666_14420 [Bradyrhizobium sp. 83002]|nr:hypothetical protein [Bradyrhizobium aeschynomenes]
MELGNSQNAHADLRLERSYASVNLVEDASFGKRPSGLLAAMLARRNVPNTRTLTELSRHCELIIEHYLGSQLDETVREIREQMLRLPKEQFDALPDYVLEDPATEFTSDSRWPQKS